MGIGNNIRKLRVLKGLSQENIADEIGMTHGNFGKIERGEIDVSATLLQKIARVLEVNVAELFDHKMVQQVQEPKTAYGTVTREDLAILALAIQRLSNQIDDLARSFQNTKKNTSLTPYKGKKRPKA